jgi:predicted RNA-binding Zn-ribbon protein involved in translation (DUF1610 family)
MYTLRKKFRIAIIGWIISGVSLALGALYLTENLLVLLIVVAVIIGGYCLSLKCPNCGKAVLHNPVKLFGMEFHMWTAWIPKNCTKCGEKIE